MIAIVTRTVGSEIKAYPPDAIESVTATTNRHERGILEVTFGENRFHKAGWTMKAHRIEFVDGDPSAIPDPPENHPANVPSIPEA